MTGADFSIELLASHDRSVFQSGVEALDAYLKTRAGQDMKRRASTCFLAIDNKTQSIAGYYTLSICHVLLSDLSETARKKQPRYSEIPAVRLGRLAIDAGYRGRKLGAALLFDAVRRVRELEVGACLLVVDAKDETAAAFYAYHGFTALPDRALQLVIAL